MSIMLFGKRRRIRISDFGWIATISFLLMLGFYKGNDMIKIVSDLLKFSLVFYTLRLVNVDERKVRFTFVGILAIGIIFYFLTFLIYRINISGRAVFVVDVYEPAKYLSMALSILLISRSFMNRKIFVLALVSSFLIFFWGRLSSTRAFILFPLVSWMILLVKQNSYRLNLLLILPLILVLVGVIGFSDILNTYRFNANIFNGRDLEALYYLESCTKEEIIFGRGFGGVNRTWIWKDIEGGSSMMHFGLMFMMLKGGLVLSVLYIVTCIKIIGNLQGRHRWFLGMFFLQDLLTTQWLFLPGLIILGIGINYLRNKPRIYGDYGINPY